MRILAAVAAVALLVAPAASANVEPDLGKVLRVFGRFAMGHACPIAPTTAITNAHVVDIQPFKPWVPLMGARFESVNKAWSGFTDAVGVGDNSDVALLRLSKPVGYYPIAKETPKPGDSVYWMSYNWDRPRDVGKPKGLNSTVVYVSAGAIFVEGGSTPGSSGSCVLNEAGAVVGLMTLGVPIGEPQRRADGMPPVQAYTAVIVGVWGDWLPPAEELEKQANPPEPGKEPTP